MTTSATMCDQHQPKLPLELQFKIITIVIESLAPMKGVYDGIEVTHLLDRDRDPDRERSNYNPEVDQVLARAVQPAVTRVCHAWRNVALPLFYKKTWFLLLVRTRHRLRTG